VKHGVYYCLEFRIQLSQNIIFISYGTGYVYNNCVASSGGYALAAALAVLSSGGAAENLSRCLVSSEKETEICSRLVDAGARDGISKKQELSIDGMTLAQTLDVLEDLRRIARG
jgi:hypothetical protein